MNKRKIGMLLACLISIGTVTCHSSILEKSNIKLTTKIQDDLKNTKEMNLEDIFQFNSSEGIDFSNLEYIKSEKQRNKKIEKAIYELYGFEKNTVDARYYYNYIDLDGDGSNEIFVYLLGNYFSGTGGGSGVIFKENSGNLDKVSQFTVLNNPIIVSDELTNGWKNLIVFISGGGAEPYFSELKFNGKSYNPNPSVAPSFTGNKVCGKSIISDNILKNKGFEL